MHQGQRRLDPLVDQVGEELGELVRREHALVDERATRQRREVGASLVRERPQFVLDALAHDVHAPLEGHVRQPVTREERLVEGRLDLSGLGADHRVVVGDVAPTQDAQALAGGDLLDGAHHLVGAFGILGQEPQAGGVLTLGGQRELHHVTQEAVGDLHQDPCAVARVGLGAGRTAVLEVAQRSDALGHDVVAAQPLHVDDEADAAGVVLESGVVEPLTGRGAGCNEVIRLPGSVGWPGRAGGHDTRDGDDVGPSADLGSYPSAASPGHSERAIVAIAAASGNRWAPPGWSRRSSHPRSTV